MSDLEHTDKCPRNTKFIPNADAPCYCGLRWRQEIIHLEKALKTEHEQHIEGVKVHAEFMNEVYEPMQARVKELEEGLAFYGDEGNYDIDYTPETGAESNVLCDGGKRARDVLCKD